MKKFYKIVLLFITLILLTTYVPGNFFVISEKDHFFLKIKKIEIKNNDLVTEDIILNRLKNIYKKNILLLEKQEIINQLKSIDYLEKVDVKKKYPETIVIKVYETKPVALIFKNNKKYVIDTSSNLYFFDENIHEKKFPQIFGNDAEKDFINFFNKLEKNNFPKDLIENFYYFQIGRWDLQLSNNQIIKFPVNKLSNSIKKSIELLDRQDFKNYSVIDLRINGKIVVE